MNKAKLLKVIGSCAVFILLFCVIYIRTNIQTSPVVQEDPQEQLQRTKYVPQKRASPNFLSKLRLLPHLDRRRELVAVMIENHEEARPHHRGLEDALMIQEWMVEGLVSRFVVLFDRHNPPETMGPIRSLRPYFVEATKQWTNVYIHAGGSPEALEMVEDVESRYSINALRGAYHDTFVRDEGSYPPHDLFLTAAGMQELLQDIEIPVISWTPYKEAGAPKGSGATTIDILFYNPLHDITFTYNPEHQDYTRINGGIESPAKPTNVLVLLAPITGEGEYGRLTIPIDGKEGSLHLFRNGRVYEGQWKKSDDWEFTLTNGKPLPFAKGQTWMVVIPSAKRLTWE